MITRKQRLDLEERLGRVGIDVLGFELCGKHIKVLIQSKGVSSFVFAGSTISDWRAVMNIVSHAKRNLEVARQGKR